MRRIVITGAGMAGGRAAVELRRAGFTGEITLVGAESHLPYDRPPLSKAVLTGKVTDTTLPLALDGVQVLTDRRATGLRPGTVETDAGPLDFDGLVIATGADPVRLPGDGPVRVLRTIDDAHRLRAALRPGSRLVIVGAGWIGAEVATTAAAAGVRVTVVEAADSPLRAALGPLVGSRTIAWYERAGVTLRLNTAVERTSADGLVLAGGEVLAADEILVGIGARPSVGCLAGSGLAVERGVVVDEHLAASWQGVDGPPVVAAGDCAAWWSRRYGRRLCVEHWDTAQHSPTVAAATLLAVPGAEVPVYDPVPYFWSEQFGWMVQAAGMSGAEGDELVWRGDPDAAPPADGRRPTGWSVGWFAPDGHLRGVATVGRPIDMVASRRLMATGGGVDRTRFADITVSMKELVAAR